MKNPIQPLANDERGVLRFKANRIVKHLLDTHPACDMNKLAMLDFSDDDRQQFAQLIGYSLGGYGELVSYVSDEAYSAAASMADGLDERDARIAALEQKLSGMRAAWQPIETAPKDGTRLMLFRSEWIEDVCIGFWSGDFMEWRVVGAGSPWMDATHWAPLPERPNVELSGQRPERT